jgi:hypothetical protein
LLVETLQPSTKFYPGFSLPKRRSSSFRSYPSDSWHFHTIPLACCGFIGFPSDSRLDYPRHSNTLPGTLFETNGTIPKNGTLQSLLGFRVFELPVRGSFQRSLTVLYSIGHQVVFSLRRWASRIPTQFLVLDGTLDTHGFVGFSHTGLLPYFAPLSSGVLLILLLPCVSPNPTRILVLSVFSIPELLTQRYTYNL